MATSGRRNSLRTVALSRPSGGTSCAPAPGRCIEVIGGDVVTSASELARLTLDIAQVHHDARAGGGRRLVYGGHTIGIAAAQVTHHRCRKGTAQAQCAEGATVARYWRQPP